MDPLVDQSPALFRRLRQELVRIPPDDLRKLDHHTMRAFAIQCLTVCEDLASAGTDEPLDAGPESVSCLEQMIENFQ